MFAGTGYVAVASVPLLSAAVLRRRGADGAARASVAMSVLSGACLAGTLAGPAHGLFQRLGLTIADAWLVAAGIGIATGRGPLAALRRAAR